jgi:uncharacterized protein YcaQ
MRRAVGLDAPVADLAVALRHHGYIQIDPINIAGRMHDLILRNRIAGYREGDLMRHLHGPEGSSLVAETRTAFEHHLPDTGVLVAFPLEAWPHLLAAMRARTKRTGPWSGRLSPREKDLSARLLAEISARGPLHSGHFEDDGRKARRVWGAATLPKATLQKLFFHGRLLISHREGNRRVYDLPERVLPAKWLATTEAATEDTARWLALLKLRQRRLVILKKEELKRVADDVWPVIVEGCPLLHCLNEDAPLLEQMVDAAPVSTPSALRLLAPLDPLVYDRRILSALWGFDYTWEVYTPEHKRVRGYYALPVLAGTELVGHVDPKADRAKRQLIVVSRRIRRGYKVAPAVDEFARWLGLKP